MINLNELSFHDIFHRSLKTVNWTERHQLTANHDSQNKWKP